MGTTVDSRGHSSTRFRLNLTCPHTSDVILRSIRSTPPDDNVVFDCLRFRYRLVAPKNNLETSETKVSFCKKQKSPFGPRSEAKISVRTSLRFYKRGTRMSHQELLRPRIGGSGIH